MFVSFTTGAASRSSGRHADVPKFRLPRWFNFTNLLLVVVMIWAAPRCWPHVKALVGIAPEVALRPEFHVVTRGGNSISTNDLRGRVVLVNIWATWCTPCRAEMPALQQLADVYASDSVVVLGLSVDRNAGDVDRFITERNIAYPVAVVGDDIIAALGGVRGYPTSFLLDKRGIIRHKVLGPIAPLTLRPAINRLVREPPVDSAMPARSP